MEYIQKYHGQAYICIQSVHKLKLCSNHKKELQNHYPISVASPFIFDVIAQIQY